MKISIVLTEKEMSIIKKYQKHLWDFSKISLSYRQLLSRLIFECGQELEIIEKELRVLK